MFAEIIFSFSKHMLGQRRSSCHRWLKSTMPERRKGGRAKLNLHTDSKHLHHLCLLRVRHFLRVRGGFTNAGYLSVRLADSSSTWVTRAHELNWGDEGRREYIFSQRLKKCKVLREFSWCMSHYIGVTLWVRGVYGCYPDKSAWYYCQHMSKIKNKEIIYTKQW